jgi:ABC-type multidrug transport system ATPase subunit
MTATPVTIQVDGLGKRFNREWIFKNLSCQFSPGNTYALIGPNGSGKSTLMQVLWGQLPASTGKLAYADAGGRNLPVEDIFQHVSIATPYLDLLEEFTLEEQLNFHFRMRTLRAGMTIDDVIERLYLSDARHKTIANFSSGMRQRLRLGMAFFTEASLLFLDEPGTNLDREAFNWYLAHLRAVPNHQTVLIASNEPREYPSATHQINLSDFKN